MDGHPMYNYACAWVQYASHLKKGTREIIRHAKLVCAELQTQVLRTVPTFVTAHTFCAS